jgi:UDP-glucose 4-epimerase
MRTLVTGAAGFIGSTLVDRLLQDGHQVVGIDNLSTGVLGNLDESRRRYRLDRRRFTFVQSDIQAPELRDIVAGSNPDVIFHLAAQVDHRASITDPQFDARNNVLGTINVAEAARQSDVSRIVYASGSAVAKLAGEMYLRAYADMYGISPICLALANVYGPRQNPHGEAGVITVFGRAMITDNAATVFGDGTAARDYVYVDDVVDAFMRAAQAPHTTVGTFNIGSGEQTTVIEVHRLIAEALRSFSSPSFAPARRGELRAFAMDSTKAHVELGWTPAVDLLDGIERTISWLRGALAPEPTALVVA